MSDEFKFDPEGFRKRLDDTLKQGREAFSGKYKDELNELSGLSKDEIDSITPDITDMQKYDELITVVKAASRANLKQAALKEEILKLGNVAVKIAERIPSLAAILKT